MNETQDRLSVERKRVVRGFHRYDSQTRADRSASFRLYPGQRESVGEAYYTHPDLPGVCFPTRIAAARAAMAVADERERCANICEAMRPHGGRAWSEEQSACYDALSDAAKNIRAGNAVSQPSAQVAA